jgi:hypothetical protein
MGFRTTMQFPLRRISLARTAKSELEAEGRLGRRAAGSAPEWGRIPAEQKGEVREQLRLVGGQRIPPKGTQQ